MPQLVRHPSSSSPDLLIEASLAADRVVYVLEGEIRRVRVPEPRPRRAVDGLWRHTCFELFVRSAGAAAYRELNFSPSGEWAAYAFASYRDGGQVASTDPAISVRRDADRLQLDARIAFEGEGRLRIGLSAVIEDDAGALSYWALRHPAGKPDFHHPDGFTLEIDAIRR